MDLRDATLMMMTESAAWPTVARLAEQAYDQLAEGGEVGYELLSDMIGEASGKGALRAIAGRHSATAFDAMISPILREIGRQKPVPPRPRPAGSDPLADPAWRQKPAAPRPRPAGPDALNDPVW
jgi:hypothetical protein